MTYGRKPAALMAALLTVGTVLSGCSGDDDKKDDAASGSTAAAGATGTNAGPSINTEAISPPDLVQPPTMKAGWEGAYKDVTLGKCEPKEGEQTVTGTIKSTAKAKADYLVTINWVNGSDVMGRAFALVRGVEPGKETPFEVKANVKRKNTACTLNVVRGTVDEASLKTATAPATPAAAKPAATTAAATTKKP